MTAEQAETGPTTEAWPKARFHIKPLILWSASNRIAHQVSTQYFGYHYVWCTPTFEAGALGRYAAGKAQPPSSDPASIYRALHAAVTKKDLHDAQVERHRTKITSVITRLNAEGLIPEPEAQEAALYVAEAHISEWIPMLYAIPYDRVADRVESVPMRDRASPAPEYVIRDLKAGEFDVIEPWPCH